MKIILIVLSAVVAIIVLAVFAVALLAFCRINNRRYDGNKNLKYFTVHDFPGLVAESISFSSDRGQILRGFLYRKASQTEPKALLLFAHGFGAGHLAYTTEINTLANAGYWVFAYDATGCGESDGKCLRGFDQGVIDLLYAIRMLNGEKRFSGIKKILVGHSWGAFCVLNAVSEEGISGAVAMCGFISGAKVLAQNTVGKKVPFLTFLAEGFLRLFNRLRFGRNANKNCLKSLRNADKPVYLIYGTADKTVYYKKNGAVLERKLRNFKNIHCKICEGRAHNPYLTIRAEREMCQTFSAISEQKKKDKKRVLSMYAEINYERITEEDPEIMRSIIDFCDRVAENG